MRLRRSAIASSSGRNSTVEIPTLFKRLHQALLKSEVFEATTLGQRESERLLIVVAQDQTRHFVSHLGEQRIAPIHREVAGTQGRAERNLDIDLKVRRVHSSRIVNRIGVEPDAALRSLNTATLRHAEIGALSYHVAIEIGAGDADRIVGAIAGRCIALLRGAHVGANPAKKQKIDPRLQNGLDQFLRRHRSGDTEQLARLCAQANFLDERG